MKIVTLTVENHKRISAVEITPEGNMVVIGGRNAQGKSSVIESLETLIAGKRAISEDPVRHGADKARIIAKFDNGLTVSKVISKDGKVQLRVSGEDGLAMAGPQELLDSFYSKLSFEPDKLLTMRAQERLEMLRQVTGADFTQLDAKRKALYDDRAQVGRDVSGRQSQIDQMAEYAGVPAKEVSIGDLMDELNQAIARNNAFADAGTQSDQARRVVGTIKGEIVKAEEAIAAWQKTLVAKKSSLTQAENRLKESESLEAALSFADTDPIQAKIDALEDTNRKVRANINRRELQRGFNAKKADYDRMTNELGEIDQQKEKMLASMKFPIPGLSFGENDLMYNGVVFGQASQAEKLRVVVAMALALHPEFKAISVRNASLLDAENMKILAQLADEYDTQIWAERVGDGAECSVIIEDGQVKKEN